MTWEDQLRDVAMTSLGPLVPQYLVLPMVRWLLDSEHCPLELEPVESCVSKTITSSLTDCVKVMLHVS